MGEIYLYDGYTSVENIRYVYDVFKSVSNRAPSVYFDAYTDGAGVDFITERIDAWQELNMELYRLYNAIVRNADVNRWVPYSVEDGTIGGFSLKFGVSPDISASISVSSVAMAEKDASDEFSDFASPLSLSGTFYLNGAAVSVTSEDSLLTISQKVNELSASTGVYSRIADGHLYIYAGYTGKAGISYEDPDAVLRELGILKVVDGALVPKHQVVEPANAVVYVNGKRFEQSTNRFENVLPYVNLVVEKKGNSSFSLFFDVESIKSTFKSIIEKYNDAIRKINSFLAYRGILSGDRALGLIRKNMVRSWQERDVTGIGINIVHDEMNVDEFSLVSYAEKVKNGLSKAVFRAVDGVPSFLEALSAIGIYSNEDKTLEFNEGQFSAKMSEDYKKVVNLLLGEDGILNRIKDYLSSVVGSEPNLISSKIDLLRSQMAESSIRQDMYERMIWERIYFLSKKYNDIFNLINIISSMKTTFESMG